MLVLAACGGGSSGAPATYTIGGTVSGLSGSGLVLQDNGGDTLKIPANGTFAFATSVMSGNAFSVIVSTQPTNPPQTCTVVQGSGTVAGSNITNVKVNCTSTYTLGGTVSGLVGSGLVLANGGANYAVSTNGPFTFATAIASGSAYDVRVATQPSTPSQTCTVSNPSGTIASANIVSILVSCAEAARFAYVVGSGQETPQSPPTLGTISVFTINQVSGALTLIPGSTTPTGPIVSSFQFVPQTSFAWALNQGFEYPLVNGFGLASIYDYAVDAATGLLTPVEGSPFSQLDGTSSTPGCIYQGQATTASITFAPTGTFGFATNVAADTDGNIAMNANAETWQFTVDPTNGAPSLVAGSSIPEVCAGGPGPVTITPSGRFLYTISISGQQYELYAFSINSGTGALTMIAGSPYNIDGGQNIVVDPSGRFVYVLSNEVDAFTVDPSSGALKSVAGGPYSIAAKSMTIGPTGRFAYFTESNGKGLSIYSIDSTTGALTAASAPVVLGYPSTLQIAPDGQFAYTVADTSGPGQGTGVYAFTIDAITGTLLAVPGSPFAPSVGTGSAISITLAP